LLLVGATGAVGREVLRLALSEDGIERVIAPTRRPMPAQPRLDNPLLDPATLADDVLRWRPDAVICTLGTTIKAAGSEAAFAAVDRDLPLRIAQCARRVGATRFALNSSLGASPRGNFYLRTKAEVEQAIRALGFPSYTIVRPSLIDTKRSEPRLGEQVGLLVARALRPLIPRRYRPVQAARIAAALVAAVTSGRSGEQTLESEDIP
jgi:uncharacterized protein YbjT (DUF2867 family)